MRLALAQINSVVGDLDGNRPGSSTGSAKRATPAPTSCSSRSSPSRATRPRTCCCGPASSAPRGGRSSRSPPRRPGIVALVGAPTSTPTSTTAATCSPAARSAASTASGSCRTTASSTRIATSRRATTSFLLRFGEVVVGPTICEDIWQPGPPATDLALAGAQLVANISASPFHVGKDREREEMLRVRARDNSCFIALCNAVGGQDELVFDGHSIVLDDEGELVARAPGFEEALLVVDLDPGGRGRATAPARRAPAGAHARARRNRGAAMELTQIELGPVKPQTEALHPEPAPPLDDLEQMRRALELGLRDYVGKNGFGDVVIGLSGGIDSALTAAIAVGALGADRVHGVSMPSRYSSEGTRGDAARLAESLGIDFREIAIEPVVEAFTAVAGDRVRRSRGRSDRGEPPGPRPGHAADGALEQVRLARRRDREQVGALGRLLDPLRRPRRRVRAAQGRLQDGRLPPVAPAERARRARADPGLDHRARPERRAPGRPARRGLAPALPGARPGARGLRRARPLARGARRGRLRPGDRRARPGDDRPRRVQAPPGAARRQAAPEGVRPRPAHADHEPLAGLRSPFRSRFGSVARQLVRS